MHTTQISLLLSNIIRSSLEQIKRRRIIPQSWFKVLHRLPGQKQMVTLQEEKECHHCLLMSTRTFPEQLKLVSMKKYREWRILELLLLLSGWGGSYEQKVSLSSAETELWQWNEVAGAAKERRTTETLFPGLLFAHLQESSTRRSTKTINLSFKRFVLSKEMASDFCSRLLLRSERNF